LKNWFIAAHRLLRTASKPDRTEFLLLFKVCLLGVAILGAIGFVIRFIFALIGLLGII